MARRRRTLQDGSLADHQAAAIAHLVMSSVGALSPAWNRLSELAKGHLANTHR